MNLKPIIMELQPKLLVGKRLRMSLSENKTYDLWSSFMPFKKDIKDVVGSEMISMQVFPEPIRLGDIDQKFDKWAVVEVLDAAEIPSGMESYSLEGGLYAVFHYIGLPTDFAIFIYIFTEWLPQSDYRLDDRPHFEVLGEQYRNESHHSEEKIWIPIIKK